MRWLLTSGLLLLAMVVFPSVCGCQPQLKTLDPGRQSMLALLMPSKVEIVKPFTRVARIEDPHSTGLDVELQLLLRASNTLGNPGLMIVGDIRVELYEYRPAGPDSKGVQLSRWTILLDNQQDQRKYWNPVTQMYEFRLGIRREDIPSAEKYVVVVTYNSPLGEHLWDEYVIAVGKLDRSAN